MAHIVEPDNVLSKKWISWQLRTLNLGNFALLITLLVVSENIGNTLRSQESQNAIATQYLVEAKQLLADSKAQMNLLELQASTLNASLMDAQSQVDHQTAAFSALNTNYTLEAGQRFAVVNTTLSHFYDVIDRLHLNDSLSFIQSKADAIATLESKIHFWKFAINFFVRCHCPPSPDCLRTH